MRTPNIATATSKLRSIPDTLPIVLTAISEKSYPHLSICLELKYKRVEMKAAAIMQVYNINPFRKPIAANA